MATTRGEKTMAGLSQSYEVLLNQTQGWKKRLTTGAEQLFENDSHAVEDSD